MTRKANKNLKSHSLFTNSDFNYLASKGYTNKEILTIWNRDLGLGHNEGLAHKEIPNIVAFLNS